MEMKWNSFHSYNPNLLFLQVSDVSGDDSSDDETVNPMNQLMSALGASVQQDTSSEEESESEVAEGSGMLGHYLLKPYSYIYMNFMYNVIYISKLTYQC